ncbi:MAG: insulinase family protein, partial [Spirochaetota bacterium]
MKLDFPLLLLLLVMPLASRAQATSASSPYSNFRLGNGLEVVVFEEHSTPFVRLDLVFKAGAIAQGPDNAGQFHLLEHLLLEGEGSSIGPEMERIAALDWNGETSSESLSFRTTIPSSVIEEGLGLWGRLVLRAAFAPEAFEAAREKVVEETVAQLSDPARIYEGAMTRRLFPKYPWRRDPAGSPTSIAAASPEGLAKLKATWIVPGNAALVIVGDVDMTTIRAATDSAFGSWKAAPNPWKATLPPQPKLGAARPTWFFLADPKIPEGMALAEIRYRGPDLVSDLPASMAADLWTALVADREGRMAKALAAGVPGIRAEARIEYLTQKEGGLVSVNAALDIGKPGSLLDQVRAFKEGFRGNEVASMRNNPAYFSQGDFAVARDRLLAGRADSMDSIDGRAAELGFAWASASLDYYLQFEAKVAATGPKEVGAFLD